jgi:hypothetical protein
MEKSYEKRIVLENLRKQFKVKIGSVGFLALLLSFFSPRKVDLDKLKVTIIDGQ